MVTPPSEALPILNGNSALIRIRAGGVDNHVRGNRQLRAALHPRGPLQALQRSVFQRQIAIYIESAASRYRHRASAEIDCERLFNFGIAVAIHS